MRAAALVTKSGPRLTCRTLSSLGGFRVAWGKVLALTRVRCESNDFSVAQRHNCGQQYIFFFWVERGLVLKWNESRTRRLSALRWCVPGDGLRPLRSGPFLSVGVEKERDRWSTLPPACEKGRDDDAREESRG